MKFFKLPWVKRSDYEFQKAWKEIWKDQVDKKQQQMDRVYQDLDACRSECRRLRVENEDLRSTAARNAGSSQLPLLPPLPNEVFIPTCWPIRQAVTHEEEIVFAEFSS